MHICLVGIEYPKDTDFGGISTYQFLLANSLSKLNNKVTVICGTEKKDYDYYENNIHVIRLHTRRDKETPESFLDYRKKVKEVIYKINEEDKIDIIESPEFSGEIIEFLKGRNIPVVVKLHTSYNIWSDLNKVKLPLKLHNLILKTENTVLNNADKIISCSEILKKLMPKYHKIDNCEKIEVLGNPANIVDFYPTKNNHQTNNILFCGSIDRRKGIFILAKAIPFVIKSLKDETIKFQIIGNYSVKNNKGINKKDELLSKIPKKFHKYIEFTGPIDNKKLNSYFNQARIGVIPSLFDNLPYVAMEELLTELPIVASSNTGIKEMITDNESGLLYQPDDYKKLAQLIIKLYRDKDFAKKIGKKGRQEILNKYSPDKIANDNIKIYQEAIKNYNEKKEINNIIKKLNLKEIKLMKNGIANHVIKCKYKNQIVIVKFYHKLKNYDYDFIKYVIDKDISCNKLIELYRFDNYNVGIYTFIKGKIKRYVSDKMLNQLFNELNKLYSIELYKKNSYTIYEKVDNYYNYLKNINDKTIRDIVKIYESLDISKDSNVILHGDLVYTNIIWNDKVNLIDFDETIAGPIEYELASFLIKNCFENGEFDNAYADRIIKFYESKNYLFTNIKNYCYFYIIKVLFEKFYYSYKYSLNLESNSQKQDYWIWWYNLLKKI